MEKEFREFYNKGKIDFKNLDESTLIILDTNVLLHIFRFSINSREQLIQSLKKVEQNLWIPYQVGLEYNLNKVELISKMRASKSNLLKEIDLEAEKFKNIVFEKLNNIGIKSSDEKRVRESVKKIFGDNLDDMINSWKNKELIKEFNLIGNVDDESNQIAEVFEGKVGSQFTQKQIDEIEKEGNSRYELNFPPGFKDSIKDTKRRYGSITYHEKYGDLIIWKQIIEKVKSDEKIDKVVFVTDDEKQDWQYISKGKKKGPRAELKKELLDEAEADLYIFNTNNFLRNVNNNKVDIVDLDLLYAKENNLKSDEARYINRLKNYNFYKENYNYDISDNERENEYILNEDLTDEFLVLKRAKSRLFSKIRSLKEKYSYLMHKIHSFSNDILTDNIITINNLLSEIRKNQNKIEEYDFMIRNSSSDFAEDELMIIEKGLKVLYREAHNINNELRNLNLNN